MTKKDLKLILYFLVLCLKRLKQKGSLAPQQRGDNFSNGLMFFEKQKKTPQERQK